MLIKLKKERKNHFVRVNINEKYLSKNSNKKENKENIPSILWNYVNHRLASSRIVTIAAILRIYAQEIEYSDRGYSQSSRHDCPEARPSDVNAVQVWEAKIAR